MLRKSVVWTVAGLLAITAVRCHPGVAGTKVMRNPPGSDDCSGPYPAWSTSPYVLPWPAGRAHRVIQGNCGGQTHRGDTRYAYDFAMEIGETFTSIAAGVVHAVKDDMPDFNGQGNMKWNAITVGHDDGTIAAYLHHHRGTVRVKKGQRVKQGQVLAGCGASGLKPGGKPHVHVTLKLRGDGPTIPFTFRNTEPNPKGLPKRDAPYEALPFSTESPQPDRSAAPSRRLP